MHIKKLTSPILKTLFLGTIIALVVVACKRQYSDVSIPSDKDANVVSFLPKTGSLTNSYYVKSTNAPFVIPIGMTNTSSKDRVINFTVTSRTAVAGQQYTAPAAVTMKAGQTLDSLSFQALFSGYTTGRVDTLVIRTNSYPVVSGQDSVRLIVRPYCDVIGTALIGDYANTSDFQDPYGNSASNYTATIVSWTPISGSSTTATIVIKNIGVSPDIGFGGNPTGVSSDPMLAGITATADWTDPSNFKITIPQQTYAANEYGYGVAKITGTGGSFSSCDQTFKLTYTITVSAGSFGTFVTTLKR